MENKTHALALRANRAVPFPGDGLSRTERARLPAARQQRERAIEPLRRGTLFAWARLAKSQAKRKFDRMPSIMALKNAGLFCCTPQTRIPHHTNSFFGRGTQVTGLRACLRLPEHPSLSPYSTSTQHKALRLATRSH